MPTLLKVITKHNRIDPVDGKSSTRKLTYNLIKRFSNYINVQNELLYFLFYFR